MTPKNHIFNHVATFKGGTTRYRQVTGSSENLRLLLALTLKPLGGCNVISARGLPIPGQSVLLSRLAQLH